MEQFKPQQNMPLGRLMLRRLEEFDGLREDIIRLREIDHDRPVQELHRLGMMEMEMVE